jgi:hypothetical protein
VSWVSGWRAGPPSTPRGRTLVDCKRFAASLDDVGRFSPTAIYSSHLPAAGGAHIDRFLKVLKSVPDAEPFVAPDPETFDEMVRQIVAAAPPGP